MAKKDKVDKQVKFVKPVKKKKSDRAKKPLSGNSGSLSIELVINALRETMEANEDMAVRVSASDLDITLVDDTPNVDVVLNLSAHISKHPVITISYDIDTVGNIDLEDLITDVLTADGFKLVTAIKITRTMNYSGLQCIPTNPRYTFKIIKTLD